MLSVLFWCIAFVLVWSTSMTTIITTTNAQHALQYVNQPMISQKMAMPVACHHPDLLRKAMSEGAACDAMGLPEGKECLAGFRKSIGTAMRTVLNMCNHDGFAYIATVMHCWATIESDQDALPALDRQSVRMLRVMHHVCRTLVSACTNVTSEDAVVKLPTISQCYVLLMKDV